MTKASTTCLAVWLAAIHWAAVAGAEEFADDHLANWHQWRGPLATGVAPRGDPPMRWDEQTHIKWKVAIPGSGTSTPIVWGEQIFLMTAIPTDRTAEPSTDEAVGERRGGRSRPNRYHQFVVLCLDKSTGQTMWQRVAREVVPHQGHHPTSTYVAASPIT